MGLLISFAVSFLLSLTLLDTDAKAQSFQSTHHEFKVEAVTRDLDGPWGFAFLPDGSMLITEKSGNLRYLDETGLSAPLPGIPDVRARGQGGLLDVAVDPAFVENNLVYLTYSEPGRGGSGTAVARGLFQDGGLRDVKVIFSQNRKTGSNRHFGSRLAFAPDGTLFFTIGDRGDRPSAQDPFDHSGSVLRINTDGSIPDDNPFADGGKALQEIWSLGHRNSQGIDVHPLTGEIWTVSHGARGGDEVNKPEAGKNYGWPVISFGRHYSGLKIGEGTAKAGMEQPLYYWDPSIAPSSMDFYDGDLFPTWKNNLFVSALAGQLIARLEFSGDEIVGEEVLLQGDFGRIRRIKSGPDGALYFINDGGALMRIVPE